MSLNIKNEATHAKVRRLAVLTGVSQTAAVDDAVDRRIREIETDSWGTRGPAIRSLLARAQQVFPPEVVAASRRAEQELYDSETGLLL
jgi:antitoxin VapB